MKKKNMSASSVSQQTQPQPQPTAEGATAAASAISSAFPAPPPFYKSFTPTNIALLAARDASHLKAEESFSSTVEGGGGEEAEAAAAVGGELAHLIPPLPPQDGKYRSFGILHDVCVSLFPPSLALLPPHLPAGRIISNPPLSPPPGADLH